MNHNIPFGIKIEEGILITPDGTWDLKSFSSVEIVTQRLRNSPLAWFLALLGFVFIIILQAPGYVSLFGTAILLMCMLNGASVTVYIHGPLGRKKVWKGANSPHSSSLSNERQQAEALFSAITPCLSRNR